MIDPSKESDNIYRVAHLVSLACVLQIAESLIPHPVPGLRLGLSNIITLIALVTMGLPEALEMTILRTVLSSFVMGTFMSPTFILSFSAGVMSTLVMGFLYWLSRLHKFGLGIVGISVLGAITHNVVQLVMAYWLLIKHPGIFVFLPWLAIGSVIMGWTIGVVAGQVCLHLKEAQNLPGQISRRDPPGLKMEQYVPGDSFLHRLSAEKKIMVLIILSLVVIIFSHFWLYALLLTVLFGVAAISRVSLGFFFKNARRSLFLLAVSFLFPVLFSSGTQVVFQNDFLRITAEGLRNGSLFAMRILFLVYVSALLARTTSPQELGSGLGSLMSPLKVVGISGERTARIFALSWMAIPVFWAISKNIIRSLDFQAARNPLKMIPLLSIFMTRFYVEADSAGWREREAACAP